MLSLLSRFSRFTALRSPRAIQTPLIRAHRRSLFIQVESTPNEHALKFLPGKPVLASTAADDTTSDDNNQKKVSIMEFMTPEEASISPLARLLFALPGVKSVLFGQDFVTVNKALDAKWAQMKPDIYAVIMDFYASGRPLLNKPKQKTLDAADAAEEEVVLMIKELLDTRIRPAVQEDGGDIQYISFAESTGQLLVKLQGSCRGCTSSAVTLKNGIENMMKHYVPEVKNVDQVLDESQVVTEQAFDEFEKELAEKKKSTTTE